MRYIALTSPVTGRRHGLVFTTPTATPGSDCTSLGSLSVGRATAIPVQPSSNEAVNLQSCMAAAASLWATLSVPQQALWNNYPGLGALGYNNFVGFNTLQFQWGLDPFVAPPGLHSNTYLGFITLYPEPDGIHSTLVLYSAATPPGTTEFWLRVYIAAAAPTTIACTSFLNAVGSANYLGSFGPLNPTHASFFDVTGALANLGIQWQPRLCYDTISDSACGGQVGWATWYETDQFGRPANNYLPELSVVQNPYTGQFIGPGCCPLPGSAPYPWPTSASLFP